MIMFLYFYEYMNVEGVVLDRCKYRWVGSLELGFVVC